MRALIICLSLLMVVMAGPVEAARKFVASSSQRLTVSSAVAGVPMTFSCFFRPASITTTGTLVGILATATDDGYYLIFRGADAGDPLHAVSNQASVISAAASTGTSGITTGVWYHGAAVYASTSDRSVFLDGVKFTNNTPVTPSGLGRTSIGAFTASGTLAFFDGEIAEVGIWNVALTDDEITSLSVGISPLRIRPSALVFYAPLWSGIFDYVGRVSITNTNGTTDANDHPRRMR